MAVDVMHRNHFRYCYMEDTITQLLLSLQGKSNMEIEEKSKKVTYKGSCSIALSQNNPYSFCSKNKGIPLVVYLGKYPQTISPGKILIRCISYMYIKLSLNIILVGCNCSMEIISQYYTKYIFNTYFNSLQRSYINIFSSYISNDRSIQTSNFSLLQAIILTCLLHKTGTYIKKHLPIMHAFMVCLIQA